MSADLELDPRAGEADVLIVGAGAAGLWAASVAARGAPGARVRVLEKTPRAGTKVLASGGTRCNLTTTLGGSAAARLFGPRGERFLRHAFEVLPPAAVRARFHALGVETVEEPELEKVFPRSQRARDVRDALVRDARAAGVEIALGQGVTGLERERGGATGLDQGTWTVRLADGSRQRAPLVMLCAGGASYPRTGTTGEGYRWLAALGLRIVPPVPALVPLTSPAGWARELAGVDWQDAEVRLTDERGKLLARRRRPLLFTHTGVSGPAAMDVSGRVARAAAERGGPLAFSLLVDLFPDEPREALRARLVAASRARERRLARVLPAAPARRLVSAVLGAAGLSEETAADLGQLGKAARHRLVETLKGLPVPIDGTLGFERAEVTAGGLELSAVDPRSMRVNGLGGLYVFGELLDLDGPIGGLNFQAAFACAEVAGRHAAAALSCRT